MAVETLVFYKMISDKHERLFTIIRSRATNLELVDEDSLGHRPRNDDAIAQARNKHLGVFTLDNLGTLGDGETIFRQTAYFVAHVFQLFFFFGWGVCGRGVWTGHKRTERDRLDFVQGVVIEAQDDKLGLISSHEDVGGVQTDLDIDGGNVVR